MKPREGEDWARQIVIDWARGQVARLGTPADDDLIGWCARCGQWLRRYACVRVEVGGEPAHACRTCGSVVDEGPPF
jgi:hypothetical protein